MAAPARVCVVDDDADIRELVCGALEAYGYTVQEAADGEEALALVESQPPGLILLDMRMPRVDGPTFLSRYRAVSSAPAPVVGMTAAPDAARLAGRMPVAAMLGKPFDLPELVAVVRRYCRP
jgi:CheY-like chemotaxis protein